MNWFSEPKVKKEYTVVEIEKVPLVEETPDSVSAVASLRHHAGFNWLLRKLKYQAARLDQELRSRRHEDIRDVDFLQSGIQWCNWLQQQLDIAHEKFLNMRPATNQEQMFFNDIESAVELIGTEPQAL